MDKKVKSLTIFSNGNSMFFDESGQQMGGLQSKGWMEVYFEWLEKQGVNPAEIPDIETVVNGSRRKVKALKNEEGEWRIEFSMNSSGVL